jgi:hypothetical protein
LTYDLPEFLSALGIRAPAVGIFFHIFVCQHHLECSTSLIEVQDVFGEKPISLKIAEKEFIDPLIDPLAHCNVFAGSRGRMSSHNDPNVRQLLTEVGSHPPSNSSTISSVFILLTRAVGG